MQSTVERLNSEQDYLTDEFSKNIDKEILKLFKTVDTIRSEVNVRYFNNFLTENDFF